MPNIFVIWTLYRKCLLNLDLRAQVLHPSFSPPLLLLGNRSLQISHISAHLLSKGINNFALENLFKDVESKQSLETGECLSPGRMVGQVCQKTLIKDWDLPC